MPSDFLLFSFLFAFSRRLLIPPSRRHSVYSSFHCVYVSIICRLDKWDRCVLCAEKAIRHTDLSGVTHAKRHINEEASQDTPRNIKESKMKQFDWSPVIRYTSAGFSIKDLVPKCYFANRNCTSCWYKEITYRAVDCLSEQRWKSLCLSIQSISTIRNSQRKLNRVRNICIIIFWVSLSSNYSMMKRRFN